MGDSFPFPPGGEPERNLESVDQTIMVGPFYQDTVAVGESGLWEPWRNCRVRRLVANLKTTSSSGSVVVEVYSRISGVDTLVATLTIAAGAVRSNVAVVSVPLKAGGTDFIFVKTTSAGTGAVGLTTQGRAL